MDKIEYIKSKLKGLNPEFLKSRVYLDDGNIVTFEYYCLNVIANQMDEKFNIYGNNIKSLDNLILNQELDTNISSHANILDIPKPKTKKGELLYSIKSKYMSNLDKVVDYGKSNLTLGETIESLSAYVNDDGYITINDKVLPFSQVIEDMSKRANKAYNLVRMEKLNLRATSKTMFSLREAAISINSKFDEENTYVRFFFEYLEKVLNRCLDVEQMRELGDTIIDSINANCTEVKEKVTLMVEDYINRENLYNKTVEEFSKGMGLSA